MRMQGYGTRKLNPNARRLDVGEGMEGIHIETTSAFIEHGVKGLDHAISTRARVKPQQDQDDTTLTCRYGPIHGCLVRATAIII